MISPKALAQLSNDIYDPQESHNWLHYWKKDDVIVGHVKIGDTDVIVIRGSATVEDWLKDAEALPYISCDIGFVHAGFFSGMLDVLAETDPVLGNDVVITGHSLGGARARILAALRIHNGWPVSQVTVFGSPKPGGAECASLVARVPLHTSYRNRQDPVPLLPGHWFWEHSELYIDIDAIPEGGELGGIEDHRISLYIKGVSS